MRRFEQPIDLPLGGEGRWKPFHLRLAVWCGLLLAWTWFGLFEGFRDTTGAFATFFTAGHLEDQLAYDVRQFQELARLHGVPHAVWFGTNPPFAAVFFRWCTEMDWHKARHVWLGLNVCCFLGLMGFVAIKKRAESVPQGKWAFLETDLRLWLLLAAGVPLYVQFTEGSVVLFTTLLGCVGFSLASTTDHDRRPWVRVGAPVAEMLALTLACALEPLWVWLVPFRAVIRLDRTHPEWRFRLLTDLTAPVFFAALLQLLAPAGLSWAGVEAAVRTAAGVWWPVHSGHIPSFAGLVTVLEGGFERGATGAHLATVLGVFLRGVPWVLALVMLRRVESGRTRIGLGLALLTVANGFVVFSTARMFLVLLGVAIFPWGRRQLPFAAGLALTLSWLPTSAMTQQMSDLPLVAFPVAWGVFLLLLMAFWRLGELAAAVPRYAEAVARERLGLGIVVVAVAVLSAFLSVVGDAGLRAVELERDRVRATAVVTGLIPLGDQKVAVSALTDSSDVSLELAESVDLVLLSEWGAASVVTPVYGKLNQAKSSVDLVLRVVRQEGVFVATERFNITDQKVIVLSEQSLEVQPWAEGYSPDPATGSWALGDFVSQRRFELDDGEVLLATDIGLPLGRSRLIRR